MSPLVRLALPVLAVAGSAYAACSATATTTIQNSGDATAIASCRTFKGDIAIQTDAPGPIALDGVQTIDGSLIVKNNSQIQQISADSLEEITGDFQLNEVVRLNQVSFPKLTNVNAVRFVGLPNLQNLGFDSKITKASVIQIDNTQLNSLDGINIETVDNMFIANNRYINSIAMQLGNISEILVLLANNPEVEVEFPNLRWAYNLTFRNCSSVKLPSLETLNNSMNLIGNVFTEFSAPNLTEVGGALSINSNFELTNISFPELLEVGDNLEVANNTKLSELDAFPKLDTIGGALDFNGNMSKIELPKLQDVKGAFNIQSTGPIQSTCDDVFGPLKDNGRIQGKYVCEGELENPGGEGTDPEKNGEKKQNSAASVNFQIGALLAGTAAALFL